MGGGFKPKNLQWEVYRFFLEHHVTICFCGTQTTFLVCIFCLRLSMLSSQASIEDRISICGQLVGMSHFMHGFLSARPALCKLQTEKVATVHSGQYTLVMNFKLTLCHSNYVAITM